MRFPAHPYGFLLQSEMNFQAIRKEFLDGLHGFSGSFKWISHTITTEFPADFLGFPCFTY